MTEASQQGAVEFVEIEDAAALDELFARSQGEPVVLFKHSTTCPISARAHREVSGLDPAVAARVALVVVQTARPVSEEIARRTGIKHESPQAFVLRGGKVAWSASHFDITADEIGRAVGENR